MTLRDHLGRSLAVGSALAVLGAGVGLTMTDRALGAAPDPPANAPGASMFSETASPNAAIGPDADSPVVESTITVPASEGGIVRDVDVVTDIDHLFPGDLDIELEHAATGTVVKLVAGPKGFPSSSFPDAFSGATWDDSAGALATANNSPYSATSFVPEGALGGLVGLPAAGDWILRVRDLADVDGGELTSWTLNLAVQDEVPPLSGSSHESDPGAPPSTIPDVGEAGAEEGVSSTIEVQGAGAYLWDADVETRITSPVIPVIPDPPPDPPGDPVPSPVAQDLMVIVEHGGRTVVITDRNSRFDPYLDGRRFDDSAPALVTRSAADDDALIPEGALSAFMGMDPNGEWKLTVVDVKGPDADGSERGVLEGWSLDIQSTDGFPPPDPGGPGDPGDPGDPGETPPPATPPAAAISSEQLCLPGKEPSEKPRGGDPGKVDVSVRQLQINQRIFQAAVRRANAIQGWLDVGVVEGDLCGGAVSEAKLGPGITTGVLPTQQSLSVPAPRPITPATAQRKANARFELSAAQFLINQRVAQAAVRRANGLRERLDGGLTGGDVRDGSITQGKLNAGLAILSAAPGPTQPASRTVVARGGGGDPSKVRVDAAQLLISQRIGQAAIRRLNDLTAQLQAGLRTSDLRNGSLGAADLSSDLK